MAAFLCTLAAAVFLCLCAPAWGQEDAPSSVVEEAPPSADDVPSSPASAGESDAGRIAVAEALVKKGRFNEALVLLRPLAERGATDKHVLFLIGLASSSAAQQPGVTGEDKETLLAAAIAAFRSILIHDPSLVRVRLELGLAFFLKEEDDLAQDHFGRVLAGNPPDPVVENINRFMRVMRARRRWSGYFGFSLAPDTNINAASDAEFIYIGGLPFRRGALGRASSDIGIVGWGGYEYQFPLADRWRLRAGFDVNHREYKGGLFDQTFLAGHVGPRFFVSRNTEMSLLASMSQRWWGGSSFNYDYGVRFEVEHVFYPGFRLSGRANWSDRKYQQNKFLEGPLMVFSLGGSYVLFPTVQLTGLVGYLQQDAQANQWDSAGYWVRGGTNVALPWGFTAGLSAEFRWTDFEAGWGFLTPGGIAREDHTRILGATLLNRGLTVFGFSPQIAFSNQLRTSNAQGFDFKRNLIEMRWVRQF